MKGSLVQLPLHRTRRHRTGHLLLDFHVTSMMMPRAPPDVAPPPVLRQNWETLARLASQWSKSLDVDACPSQRFHPLIGFEAQTYKPPLTSFWGPKPRNRCGDFEAQITKPSTLVLRHKLRNHCSGFEAKPLTNHSTNFEAKPENSCFSSAPRVRCGLHTASPDLPIVWPPSTRLVPDHPWSSALSLLLLPRSSSLFAMSHSPPTHHETSKHVSLHRITKYGLVQPKCTKSKFKLKQVN
jgi:hypothetical protein